MYVVYHSSDLFAEVTGVSMTSLFENNQHMNNIHVLYIERGMSDKKKKLLECIAAKYGRELEFMEMPDWSDKLNIELKSCKEGWLGFGYNRLFLTEYISKDVDCVLYLDSDTIVEAPLDELWNTDLGEYYMAGVDDCLSSKYREIVGLDDSGVYCNAGMLLINLKKWREDEVTKRFIQMICENNGYFVFNEQSILNSLFSGAIKILPQKFNVNSLVYLFSYKELMKLRQPRKFSYTEEEYMDARQKPVITHYTGNFYVHRRPWVEKSDHPHKASYLHYRDISPWKDASLMPDQRKKSARLYTEICRILSRAMMIEMVSVLYNDIRPSSFRKKTGRKRMI